MIEDHRTLGDHEMADRLQARLEIFVEHESANVEQNRERINGQAEQRLSLIRKTEQHAESEPDPLAEKQYDSRTAGHDSGMVGEVAESE